MIFNFRVGEGLELSLPNLNTLVLTNNSLQVRLREVIVGSAEVIVKLLTPVLIMTGSAEVIVKLLILPLLMKG